jgi:hypothetical protein
MKQKRLKLSAGLLLSLAFFGVQAQEAVSTTGGEASGGGGTTSYSVGQVVYTSNIGTNGSVAQGVQQPYEISTITGINETSIQLELSVYPNPTTNFLNLKFDCEKIENLSYQLYDLQGRVIENEKVNDNSTTIKMEGLPKATYFLKVTNNQNVVKTFKVIKN